jgi:hypothetical protein
VSLYLKIILILFGLAYLISPVDIIPDLLLPYIGWIDDGVIIGTIIYLIRYGKLPNFFFKKKGVKEKKFSQPKTEKFKTDDQTPYEILGINPSASKKEINRAYKEAIKKYHPDKLSHLGEEFSDLANEKFLAIQKAYDTLMGK